MTISGQYEASFREFVAARWPVLLRAARLLVGDHHRGEDLLQSALARLWYVWPRVRDEAPEPYLRQVMVRLAIRSARRRWWREHPTETLPETAVADPTGPVADRQLLERALSVLTARQRAVVVLRYLEDLPPAEIAAVLGCSVTSVGKHTARALQRLRRELGDEAMTDVGRRL